MFSKEKVITVTVKDYIDKDALYHAEFTDKNGNSCLVQICRDDYPMNPREDSDHLWTWVTTYGAGYSDRNGIAKTAEDRGCGGMPIYRKYYHNPEDYEDDEGYIDKDFLKENLVVRLYLYRHSGDRISTGSFYGLLPQGHAEFDSGCMGFAYVSREKMKEWYRCKQITKKIISKARACLEAEVDEVNAVNSGDVYYIKVTNLETEEEDSCGGYICSKEEYLRDAIADMLSGWVDNPAEIVKEMR